MANRQQGSERLISRSLLAWAAGLALLVAVPSPQAQGGSAMEPSGGQAPTPANRASGTASGQASIPAVLPKGKKLILTNGTFQMVREYHRDGDRLRYYSVERSAWEEIPASLVDWEATQKAEAEQEAHDKELVQKIKASEAAARTAEIDSDRSLEVRAGVILPDDAGLYVLDGQHVSTMEQDLAVSRLAKGREVERIVTGIPLISTKHQIELPGKRAKLRIHAGDAEFYFRPVDGRDAHLSLLRADVSGDKRELETMSTNMVGVSNYKNHEIPLLAWDAARGVKRFTVEQKLAPGEYAIVEARADGEVDLYVWDFGVDAAPAGKNSAP